MGDADVRELLRADRREPDGMTADWGYLTAS
jgi:hypothetical protein